MIMNCNSILDLRQQAATHREETVTQITLGGYVKKDNTKKDYILVPLKYGVLIDSILTYSLKEMMEEFEKRNWVFAENIVQGKLDAYKRAQEDFALGNKSSTRGTGFRPLGLSLFEDTNADNPNSLWIKDVVVVSPEKKYADLNTALTIVGCGGYVATFKLTYDEHELYQNFDFVSYETE